MPAGKYEMTKKSNKTPKSNKKDGPDRTDPSVKTQFQPGNQFWKARSSHGPKPKFSDPDVLWTACLEYFQWVTDNPIMEEKVFHTAGIVTRAEVAHMVAMTITGLCLFLDISEDTWANYRNKPDLLGVATRADNYIKTQKLTGAAADLLNPNIIARDLGLRDNVDSNIKSDITIRVTYDDELKTEDDNG